VFSNKNMLLQAYTQDIINVQTFHNGVWQDARLKDVLYGRDASVYLFSLKAVTQNGYSTTLNEKETVISRGDGSIAALVILINDLYLLAIRVCIPQHVADVHLATQAETLQVWHECLGHQNNRHVIKVLKQHGMVWKKTKKFLTAVLWVKRIEFRNSDMSTKLS
jgi:hypothetical protein